MIAIICFALVGLGGIPPASDTIDVAPLASAPALDGRVARGEYGDSRVRIATTASTVRVWIAQHGDFLYIAATLPDSTFYWGDDFVVSVDANGSADSTPQSGDRQWYLRRTLDSSVVFTAIAGRWSAPGAEPPALGATRHADDWEVASSSSPSGWTVELRIRVAMLTASTTALPRIAFRTYNDGPRGWWSWPEPPAGTPPQRVERSLGLWAPLRVVIPSGSEESSSSRLRARESRPSGGSLASSKCVSHSVRVITSQAPFPQLPGCHSPAATA